jgi:hypothetical protein
VTATRLCQSHAGHVGSESMLYELPPSPLRHAAVRIDLILKAPPQGGDGCLTLLGLGSREAVREIRCCGCHAEVPPVEAGCRRRGVYRPGGTPSAYALASWCDVGDGEVGGDQGVVALPGAGWVCGAAGRTIECVTNSQSPAS